MHPGTKSGLTAKQGASRLPAMGRTSRKVLFAIMGLGLLGALLYRMRGFIPFSGFSGELLVASVREARISLLLLSLVTIYICFAIRAVRWMRLARRLGAANFGNIYRMTLAGFSAMFLLGRAGEPVRPLLLARKEKLPIADTFGVYVLERLIDAASAVVIAAIGLIVFTANHHSGGAASALEKAARTTGSVLFAGVLAAIGFLIYLRLHGTAMLERRLEKWHHAHGWRGHAARMVLGFARGVQTIRTWSDLGETLAYSGGHWALVALVYYWTAQSFGGTLAAIGFGGTLLVLAFALVGSAVQLPGVGGGSQVATFLAYTAIFGVENERAAVAAIVVWLITFASCSLAGVPLLVHEGWSLGELRRVAQKEEEESA